MDPPPPVPWPPQEEPLSSVAALAFGSVWREMLYKRETLSGHYSLVFPKSLFCPAGDPASVQRTVRCVKCRNQTAERHQSWIGDDFVGGLDSCVLFLWPTSLSLYVAAGNKGPLS